MMSIDSAILESLIQDGKTVELINNYLQNCCNLSISLNELKKKIIELYEQDLLKIAFPPQYVNIPCLQDFVFKEYWFELSDNGEKECIRRNLMSEI